MIIVEQVYIDAAKIMKALSDPKRLKIVDMLSHGEMCAKNIQSAFSISQPTLSHDMRVLKEAGITTEKRVGKNIFYTINVNVLNNWSNSLDVIVSQENSYVNDDASEEQSDL